MNIPRVSTYDAAILFHTEGANNEATDMHVVPWTRPHTPFNSERRDWDTTAHYLQLREARFVGICIWVFLTYTFLTFEN